MNSYTSAADAYRQATFENAPPIKIVRLMYQGAMRFLDEALTMGAEADPTRFRDRLNRAEAVIVELRISLEPDYAPELCRELERLYLFAEDAIHQAIQSGDVEPLYGAKRVLSSLFEAWQEIELREQDKEAA
ncbi:MAG: flagellar export chaperone FliS [Planctomycetota bacterium]